MGWTWTLKAIPSLLDYSWLYSLLAIFTRRKNTACTDIIPEMGHKHEAPINGHVQGPWSKLAVIEWPNKVTDLHALQRTSIHEKGEQHSPPCWNFSRDPLQRLALPSKTWIGSLIPLECSLITLRSRMINCTKERLLGIPFIRSRIKWVDRLHLQNRPREWVSSEKSRRPAQLHSAVQLKSIAPTVDLLDNSRCSGENIFRLQNVNNIWPHFQHFLRFSNCKL